MPDKVDVRLVKALVELEQTVRQVNHDTIALVRDLRVAVDEDLFGLPADGDPNLVQAAQEAAERLVRSCTSLTNVISISVQKETDRLRSRIEILDRYTQ